MREASCECESEASCEASCDNAPYHRLKGPHHIDLKKLGRADLVKLMRTQDEADAQRAQDLARIYEGPGAL